MVQVTIKKMAFTLIELLIVVAIIGILAAIAVPNFLNAQIRAKTARVQADIKMLDTAIQTYYLDHNDVPPDYNTGKWSSFMISHVPVLTTPVAYVAAYPHDPFNKGADTSGATWVPNPEDFLSSEYQSKQGGAGTFWTPFGGPNQLNGKHDFRNRLAMVFSIGPSMIRYFPGEGYNRGCWHEDFDSSNGLRSFGSIRRFMP